ncbi:hypothetical protein ACVWYQ_003719 [Bradyrhizobium sp. USDA 3397]
MIIQPLNLSLPIDTSSVGIWIWKLPDSNV